MTRTFAFKAAGLAVLALSMAGCKSSPEKAAEKNLTDLKDASKDAAATSAAGKTLPNECQAYMTKVDSCVKKLGADTPAAATFKTAMENARNNWANIPDQMALSNACKQADAQFSQTAAAMGCK